MRPINEMNPDACYVLIKHFATNCN